MECVVDTKNGKVEGVEKDGILQWLGIPFAEPPVGALRFKRAVPGKSWSGVRKADHYGNRPVQFAKSGAASHLPESEDCLYLNVWAPEEAEKCPVFVWIYGGGGHGGEGSAPSYSGESFARDGVVYVSFNYRLGPLGFYNFSLFDETFDSNCALSDVLQALRWIRENIQAFGGDPENVTICGQSAGASFVYSLLAVPQARGLFQKAIAMSPTITSSYQKATHESSIRLFLDKLGMKEGEIQKLKELPAEQMKDAAWEVFVHGPSQRQANSFPFVVVDDLLPVPVYDALKQGSAEGVSVMFGCCKDEGSAFYASGMYPTTEQELEDLLEYSGCPEKLVDLKAIYPDTDAITMKRLGGDLMFGAEVARGLEMQEKYAKTYNFQFDFLFGKSVEEGGPGVCHGADVEVALGTQGTLLTSIFGEEQIHKISGRREALSKIMHGAWVQFCKNGDPNGELPTEWKPYTEKEKNVFVFNDECRLLENPKSEAYKLWNEIDYFAEEKGKYAEQKKRFRENEEYILP